MTQSLFKIPVDYPELRRPHVSEWFGHRVFPVVSGSPAALADQKGKHCPFLSTAFRELHPCIKLGKDPAATANSEGVCTISSTSNKARQDWIVCPIRALDDDLLEAMVRRLFRIRTDEEMTLTPASALEDPDRAASVADTVHRGDARAFVYFQNKLGGSSNLGGEIGLPKTDASPQMSFDTTVVELLPADHDSLLPGSSQVHMIQPGRYGVIELQTTDTHGSYQHAVKALRNGLDLHPIDFHAQLAANPEWSRRRIEGPNVANVFKRTFYQVAFKFQVTKRDTSVGCVLVLPQPVWDSWKPFLGDPSMHDHGDGTWRLLDDDTSEPSDWIYVFDIADKPDELGGPAPISVKLAIGTDAATLSRAALEVAPARAVERGGGHDAVAGVISQRIQRLMPGLSV